MQFDRHVGGAAKPARERPGGGRLRALLARHPDRKADDHPAHAGVADELDQLAYAEGNSNLAASKPPPTPGSPAVAVRPSATAVAGQAAAASGSGISPIVLGGGLAVLALLVAVALLAWRRPGAGPR